MGGDDVTDLVKRADRAAVLRDTDHLMTILPELESEDGTG
jgi:hypothetical protein